MSDVRVGDRVRITTDEAVAQDRPNPTGVGTVVEVLDSPEVLLLGHLFGYEGNPIVVEFAESSPYSDGAWPLYAGEVEVVQ